MSTLQTLVYPRLQVLLAKLRARASHHDRKVLASFAEQLQTLADSPQPNIHALYGLALVPKPDSDELVDLHARLSLTSFLWGSVDKPDRASVKIILDQTVNHMEYRRQNTASDGLSLHVDHDSIIWHLRTLNAAMAVDKSAIDFAVLSKLKAYTDEGSSLLWGVDQVIESIEAALTSPFRRILESCIQIMDNILPDEDADTTGDGFGSALSSPPSSPLDLRSDNSQSASTSSPEWALVKSGGEIPLDAESVGRDINDQPLFAARVDYKSGKHIGKAGRHFPGIYISYAGSEIQLGGPFEVLVHLGNTHWEEIKKGSHIPKNAVVGGFESDGQRLYIGRAVASSSKGFLISTRIESLVPGKVGSHLGGINLPFDTKELALGDYEILVTNDAA